MISLEDSLCLIITGSTPVLITWMLIWLMQKQCFHHIMQHLLFKTLPWDVPIWPGLSLATLSLVFFFSSNSCIGIGCFLLQTLQVQCWLQFLVLWVLSIGFKHPKHNFWVNKSLLYSSADLIKYVLYCSNSWSVSYSGCLGDQYTALGTQTLAPKNLFSSFLISVVFQQKICSNGNQLFHNVSNYFEMA